MGDAWGRPTGRQTINNDQLAYLRASMEDLWAIRERAESAESDDGARDAYLSLVHEASWLVDLATGIVGIAVERARDAGATWDQLAEQLGVTRSAVIQRYRERS